MNLSLRRRGLSFPLAKAVEVYLWVQSKQAGVEGGLRTEELVRIQIKWLSL